MERKKIIILGGSSGIGKATAERFAKEGWLVVIASSNLEKVEQAISGLEGDGHMAFEVDVRNEQHISKMEEQLRNYEIEFDVLVNSVGVSTSLEVINADFKQWDDTLQVMLYGTVKTCRSLIPLLKDGGRVINITSIHDHRVEYGSSAYGVAKAAVTQFTRSLALELASRKILANTIAPGFVDTPMSIDSNGNNEVDTQWFYDNYVKYGHLPLKRAGKADEVAGVVYFLAGPDSTYMTGSVVTVDGGLTITF